MKNLKIDFYFKSHRPKHVPIPIANAKFKHQNNESLIPCLIDSGADFCTVPIEIGKFMLNIDFENKLAPYEIRREWQDIDKSDSKKFNGLVEKIIENQYAIPNSIECACGKGSSGYYCPVQIEIGVFKKQVLVFWINSNVIPLIGRIGVFDQMKKVVFDTKKQKGQFYL